MRFTLILTSNLCFSIKSCLFPLGFLYINFTCSSHHPLLLHVPLLQRFDHSNTVSSITQVPKFVSCLLLTLPDLRQQCLMTAHTYDRHPIGKPRDCLMQCACVWSVRLLFTRATKRKDSGMRSASTLWWKGWQVRTEWAC